MKIKHMVREAMKRACTEMGTTLAREARRFDMSRQLFYHLLTGSVSGSTIAVCMAILCIDRPAFERFIMSEWRRALDAGCEVIPPRMYWASLMPDESGSFLAPPELLKPPF